MTSRDPGTRGLSESEAKHVLERAARIDASARLGISIPELRSAAMEAGIAEAALDQALAEVHPSNSPIAEDQRNASVRRNRRLIAIVAILVLIVAAAVLFLRARETPVVGIGVFDETSIEPEATPELGRDHR